MTDDLSMSEAINPYQSPKAADPGGAPSPPWLSRQLLLRPILLFGFGAVIGCVSFIAAISLVPGNVPNPTDHDRSLAINLGFIFPPLVGLWSGWLRRSIGWSLGGIVIGLSIGGTYRLLCGFDFLAIMVAYPCLLGGAASAALGSGKTSWHSGLLARFGKGLVAGFVLGSVYMVVLNAAAFGAMPQTTAEYHGMMTEYGPISMGIAGGLYLILFVWASSLKTIVLGG